MKTFQSGRYVQQGHYKSFQPNPINRAWVLDNMELIQLLGQADRELGRLDMYSDYIPDIDLFVLLFQERLFHVRLRAFDSARLRGLLQHMHADEQVDVRDIVRIHVQPAQLPIGLTEQLDQLHVVQHPGTVDWIGLKTLVMPLLNVAAGLEGFHRSGLSLKAKTSTIVILDFTHKLK